MSYKTILLLVLTLSFAGCASRIQPLRSKPPVASLNVILPISVSDDFHFVTQYGQATIPVQLLFPIGTYLPVGETDDGYCYESPQGFTVSSVGPSREREGGIFWKRGLPAPGHVYIGKTEAKLMRAKTVPGCVRLDH